MTTVDRIHLTRPVHRGMQAGPAAAHLQGVARGWIEVIRLAERQRRKDAGEPLLKVEKANSA